MSRISEYESTVVVGKGERRKEKGKVKKVKKRLQAEKWCIHCILLHIMWCVRVVLIARIGGVHGEDDTFICLEPFVICFPAQFHQQPDRSPWKFWDLNRKIYSYANGYHMASGYH